MVINSLIILSSDREQEEEPYQGWASLVLIHISSDDEEDERTHMTVYSPITLSNVDADLVEEVEAVATRILGDADWDVRDPPPPYTPRVKEPRKSLYSSSQLQAETISPVGQNSHRTASILNVSNNGFRPHRCRVESPSPSYPPIKGKENWKKRHHSPLHL